MRILSALLLLVLISSCETPKEEVTVIKTNFEKRYVSNPSMENLELGATYLPVYSHVYQMHGNNNLYLTITTSLRNTSATESLYILKADYYDTAGKKIREYLKKPIELKPLETVEIIIDQVDREGGSGANFIFDWAIKDKRNLPLFEAVMISTYGQQGVSFTTNGTQIYK
ncbi:DUF3124 domain-containing protein [Flavicella sp.]|uniref:DUF3124 domain-containing protein n=1 Tax=Flavicella sp. TaxID=2957742 RepID=UPI00262DE7AD|nr:DUF3124 domain-containing protein [Flavicella sp.]MDG1805491.1 DUF3124 domain-containing protein [Flavicella sp.]